MSRLPRTSAVALLPVVLLIGAVLTASTVVPGSKAGRNVRAISDDDLKPAACAALTVNGVTTGSGTFNDGGQSHLVLGSAAVDTIRGQGGNDCILGGGANDSLRGDGGTDVCIGGPGTDTFHASCETQIQ